MGYHKSEITQGSYGDISKIFEELEELADAEAQDIKVMALCELSDIIGAIDGYLLKRYPSITLIDLIKMAAATTSAFADGTRKTK